MLELRVQSRLLWLMGGRIEMSLMRRLRVWVGSSWRVIVVVGGGAGVLRGMRWSKIQGSVSAEDDAIDGTRLMLPNPKR